MIRISSVCTHERKVGMMQKKKKRVKNLVMQAVSKSREGK